MRQCFAVALLVLLVPAPSRAQGYFPIPNQLSLGIGAVHDQQPSQVAPTVVFSFAFADSGNDFWPYRAGFVWEAEVGSTSDVESCQAGASSGGSANCGDAAMLVGLRVHAFRRQARRLTPFGSLMLGSLSAEPLARRTDHEGRAPYIWRSRPALHCAEQDAAIREDRYPLLQQLRR
jgi:hypothetical protein